MLKNADSDKKVIIWALRRTIANHRVPFLLKHFCKN